MTSNGGSSRHGTPTRRYGEILGNIFGNSGSSKHSTSNSPSRQRRQDNYERQQATNDERDCESGSTLTEALIQLHHERSTTILTKNKGDRTSNTTYSNLLDDSVLEEAKRRFRERRQQSQSPSRRRKNHDGSSDLANYDNNQPSSSPMTVDMSNGRPATPERRQPPPSSTTGITESGTTVPLSPSKVSYRELQSSKTHRSATPPPRQAPPRQPPPRSRSSGSSGRFMMRRRQSAKQQQQQLSESSPTSAMPVSNSTTTRTGLPSTMSASAVRARSISPGWNRRRLNFLSGGGGDGMIKTNSKSNVSSNKNATTTKEGEPMSIEDDKTPKVSFSQTIATAATEIQLKNQISTLETTIGEQRDQLQFYESRLTVGTNELSQVHRELIECRKTQARLELELEVHDTKFSVYEDYRRLLDSRRLQDDQNGLDNDFDDSDDDREENDVVADMKGSNNESTGRKGHHDPQKQQGKDLARVLSKLERFEDTMKRSEVETDKRYTALYEEYKIALTKIYFLERQHQADKDATTALSTTKTTTSEGLSVPYASSGPKSFGFIDDDENSEGKNSLSSTIISDPIFDLLSSTNRSNNKNATIIPDVDTASKTTKSQTTTPESTACLLRKRINILEAENRRQKHNIHSLNGELERLQAVHDDKAVAQMEEELVALRREKSVLSNRVEALETELGYTMGQIDDKTRTRRYRTLEKNLNEYTVEIMSLEDKLRAKDSVISRLKERDLSRRLGIVSMESPISPLSSPKNKEMSLPTHHSKTFDQGEADNGPFVTDADVMRSRLHKKVEELKTKTKHMGSSSSNHTDPTDALSSSHHSALTSGSDRVAMLRQRLGQLSKMNGLNVKEYD